MIEITHMISILLFGDGMFVFGSAYDNGSFYDDQRYLLSMRNRDPNRSRWEYSDESDYRRYDSSDSNYSDALVIEVSEDYEDRREICRPPPKCRPICRPVQNCKPDHCKKRRHFRKNHHGHINFYIQLIQRALAQGLCEIHKLSKCYLEDVKTRLFEGLQLIWKTAEAVAHEELERFEKKLISTVICHNKNILRDAEALIILTNGEILDDLVMNIKTANKDLIRELSDSPLLPPPPINRSSENQAPPVPPLPLATLIQFVNSTFNDLTDNLSSSFKKPIQSEKNALQKLVNENRNSIIGDVTKLINEFEQKLSKYFVDLAENEIRLIRSIMDQSARKILCDLEHVIHQIGQNIISILKGCNTAFRPQLLFEPQFGGWTNVSESQLLYN